MSAHWRFLPCGVAALGSQDFIARYSSLQSGEKSSDGSSVCVVGRLASKRDASSKLIFYDLVGGRVDQATPTAAAAATEDAAAASTHHHHAQVLPKIQIMATRAAFTGVPVAAASADSSTPTPSSPADEASLNASFKALHHCLKRGDLVWARGTPAKSKVGELSLIPQDIVLLAPCWHEIPAKLLEPVRATTNEQASERTSERAHSTSGGRELRDRSLMLTRLLLLVCSVPLLSACRRTFVTASVTWTCW